MFDCGRRMFRQFFQDGKFDKVKGDSIKTEKLEKFRQWLKQQYFSVKAEILASARSPVLEMQVPAIRTVIEVGGEERVPLIVWLIVWLIV